MDDRDALANLIDPNALELDTYPWPRDAADRVLASDWLAGVKAAAWWEGVNDQWKHRPVGNRVLESQNPHRKGTAE